MALNMETVKMVCGVQKDIKDFGFIILVILYEN